MEQRIQIIGIDCATDPANVGLACGWHTMANTTVELITTGAKGVPVAPTIAGWLRDGGPTLLALDSPLGWPEPIGRELAHHRAGAPLTTPIDTMFRRATDRFIRERLSKQPMEVAADRIARTAHAALGLLEDLRELTGRTITLAWDAGDLAGNPHAIRAIEVYPAATLRAHGYRKGEHPTLTEEQAILALLSKRLSLPAGADQIRSRHAVDAAACVLAGADFLCGAAPGPSDLSLAMIEGWIWARVP
jgi:Protein of unknown function (DUF429)